MAALQDSERTLPCDLDAEQALLGSLMQGGEASTDADDFTRESHRAIFAAITDIRAQGAEPDAVALSAVIPADIPKHYLLELNGLGYASRSKQYAAIVKERSRQRECITIGEALVRAGYERRDPDEASGEAMTALANLADTGKKRSVRLRDVVRQRLIDYLIPTQLLHFPGTYACAHFGDPTVIAGETGAGKTAYAIECADTWRKNYKVLFLTYEMSAAELGDRFVSRAVGVSSEVAYDGLSERDQSIYEKGCHDLLDDKNLVIKECAGMREGQLAQTLRIAAAHGTKVAIVDYLQIAHDDTGNENADITRFMHMVQSISKSTGMAVILLSQYNRDIQGKPGLRNLRGSGSIGQETANGLLMWAPPEDEQEAAKADLVARGYCLSKTDPRTLVRVEWAKRRHGKKGSVDYYLLDGATMTFTPIDREAR